LLNISASSAHQREPDALRATQFKLGLQGRPCDALAPVFVERCKTAVQLSLLCACQRKLVVFQAVPKLRDEREALRRSQSLKLIVGEPFQALSIGGNLCKSKRELALDSDAGRRSGRLSI